MNILSRRDRAPTPKHAHTHINCIYISKKESQSHNENTNLKHLVRFSKGGVAPLTDYGF